MNGAPPDRVLTDEERVDWLRLIRTDGVGPTTFLALLERFASPAAAIEALPELSRRGGARQPPRVPSRADAEREIHAAHRLGARLVALGEPDYPAPLAAIADPPPVLTLHGDAALLRRPMLGVVGARNASANGRKLARAIAADLAAAGLVVVSGLARGIDTAAHEGAGPARTVAVVAGGIDVVYPQENAGLYARIAAEGCAVAEMPLGAEPQGRHFPRRNRIVSGLARGILVVEAARRSGSLITARRALDQGRDVFAVPGSPLDERCHGCNDLIRQGAVLTESARDVLDALSGGFRAPDGPRPPMAVTGLSRAGTAPPLPAYGALDSARSRILELLSPSPIAVDELIRECQVSVPDANAVLLELELAGRISRSAGNQVALIAVDA